MSWLAMAEMVGILRKEVTPALLELLETKRTLGIICGG